MAIYFTYMKNQNVDVTFCLKTSMASLNVSLSMWEITTCQKICTEYLAPSHCMLESIAANIFFELQCAAVFILMLAFLYTMLGDTSFTKKMEDQMANNNTFWMQVLKLFDPYVNCKQFLAVKKSLIYKES